MQITIRMDCFELTNMNFTSCCYNNCCSNNKSVVYFGNYSLQYNYYLACITNSASIDLNSYCYYSRSYSTSSVASSYS